MNKTNGPCSSSDTASERQQSESWLSPDLTEVRQSAALAPAGLEHLGHSGTAIQLTNPSPVLLKHLLKGGGQQNDSTRYRHWLHCTRRISSTTANADTPLPGPADGLPCAQPYVVFGPAGVAQRKDSRELLNGLAAPAAATPSLPNQSAAETETGPNHGVIVRMVSDAAAALPAAYAEE